MFPAGHKMQDGDYMVYFVNRTSGYPVYERLGHVTIAGGVVEDHDPDLKLLRGEPSEAVTHRYRLPYFEIQAAAAGGDSAD